MRVLHWYPGFLGGGGVANAVGGLARAEQAAGATVAIAVAESRESPLYGGAISDVGAGIEVIRWRSSWTLKKGNLVLRGLPGTARRALVGWKPDVVHIHGEFNPDNLRVPFLFSCPLVLSPHGAFHPEALSKSNPLLKRLYITLAGPVLYRRAVFHRISPGSGDPTPCPDARLRSYVAPNGPSVPIVEPLSCAGAAGSGASIEFLFVGRLDVHTKGLDLLLSALAEAVAKHPHLRCSLTLVGPDWNGGRAFLERQSRSLGVQEYVRLEGTKTGEDLVKFYERSDVYIHCSRNEGQSIAVAEALLFAKPAVLSSRIGAVDYPEIGASRGVLVVEPRSDRIAEAMTRVAEDLHEFRSAAREQLPVLRELLSWNGIAAIHLTEYSRAISARATAR